MDEFPDGVRTRATREAGTGGRNVAIPVVEVSDLAVGRGRFRVDLGSWRLDKGDVVLLKGPNGSGKTTALSCLAGLLPPVRGLVSVMGRPLYGLFGARTDLRRRVVLVAAEPYLFRGNVVDNVSYGLVARGLDRKTARKQALDALREAGLVDLADKWSGSLSSGQVRRVALIRAAVCRPDLLLLDEPDGDLDEEGRAWLVELVSAMRDRVALLVATHVGGALAGLAEREIVVPGRPEAIDTMRG